MASFSLIIVCMMLFFWGCSSLSSIKVSLPTLSSPSLSHFSILPSQSTSAPKKLPPTPTSGLPWSQSITSSRQLTYMPMVEDQLKVISELGMTPVEIDEKFTCQTSTIKPAKIGSMCFQNSLFRQVRMTYFDAGDSVQVFNTLWVPSLEYDLPMLGVDLISLGKTRVLSVIDFQPLHPTDEYSAKYIAPLTNIRNKYPDLHGVLSGKIYDDTSFFSKNMLFGRFTDESKVPSVVSPAFSEYLREYVKLAQNSTPDHSESAKAEVLKRQTAYECYSAEKDPAVGLFDAYFGKEWSSSFVHQFLFPLSAASEPSKPVHNFKLETN